MLAVSFDSFGICLFDMNTGKLVREFYGHSNKITDMAFSHDVRQLISTSLDGTMIIWDLVSGNKVDWISLPTPATSVDFHPDGLYVATVHAGMLGICLWINKSRFGAHSSLQNVISPTFVSLPLVGEVTIDSEDVAGDEQQAVLTRSKMKRSREEDKEQEDKERAEKKMKILEQKGDMITLSGLPNHHWLTVTNLDAIRVCNPFFSFLKPTTN